MKSKWFKWTILSILEIFVALLATQALAAAGDTIRVSVASNGTQGNGDSRPIEIFADGHYVSSDGRYVVFESSASNLVSGDTDGFLDIFVHDRETGTTMRVSVASDGSQANGSFASPSISSDGRYVVFVSAASNLVSGDTNGMGDVFVHDMQTGVTTRISVASDGSQENGEPYSPSISADGHFVVFWSYASNLVSGDTNGYPDVFVHDRITGVTSLISVASDGTQGNNDSTRASISADGRYVAFSSVASNLVSGDTNGVEDIFVHDRQTGTTMRVSIASDGAQANGYSYSPSFSANGRYVAFESPASNLVGGDTNGDYDIFVHDRQTGITSRISVASDGMQGNSNSYASSLSADGRFVVFESEASNLVSGDTNGNYDIFVHDRQTGVTVRASLASDGTQGNGLAYAPSISADGHFVVFGSSASNLVGGDTNGVMDVFVHEIDAAVFVPTPTPTVAALPKTGFAPQRTIALSAQPAKKVYFDLGDLWLEIPRLGVQMPIVGVPQVDGEWDVSWLGNQAGWLNGTAFPTWAGNSVLTGHVYDAYGKPGPFVHLNGLWWGDKVVVHAWGAQYVYEVRQVMQVAPGATSSVIKHEELPWVTLITCRGYDEASNSYKYRVVVRAVLVEVK